jgi:uncharacterized surface anchored protein
MLKKRRITSGVMALLICCSTIFNFGSTVHAAESAKPEITESSPKETTVVDENVSLFDEGASDLPTLVEIQERLLEDEIVIAEDITIEADSGFDISTDFTKITFSKKKVNMVFKNAVNKTLDTFQTEKPGTYQAVYEVYPLRDSSLAYQISRMITVRGKEPQTESQKKQTENRGSSGKEDSESEEDSEPHRIDAPEALPDSNLADSSETSAKAAETDVESPEENTKETEKDLESFDTASSEDTKQDTENELVAMEEDENLYFSVVPARMAAQRSSTVSLVKGKKVLYPSNLGNYETNYFYVNGKLAYCLESPKSSPPDADYVANVLETNAKLQKVLYYGYGGPGDLTDQYMPQMDGDLRFVFTHLAASYAYIGNAGFHGCSMEALEKCGVINYINYLFGQEAPPVAAISLSSDYEKAYLDGDIQKTKTFTLTGDHRNYVTINIPANVTFHNVSNGKSQTGGSIKVYGNTKFYFTAPKTVTGEWKTGTLRGQIGAQWKTLVLSTGNTIQDIGYGDFIEEKANSISFTVKWLDIARITLTKKDQNTNVNLAGAVFGVYSDKACTKLITKMPATDKNGNSFVEFTKTQEVAYIKEITAPTGYCLNTSAYNVKLIAGGNTNIAVNNKEQKGRIIIRKTGEKLVSTDKGDPVTFVYENSVFGGATYSIYAAEDIIGQDKKTVIWKKDTLIETLTTAEDGNAKSQELHLGKYRIVEKKAPADLTIGKNEKETTKEVVLEYAGQEVALSEARSEYNNKRPEIIVKSVKKSQNDDVTLEGAIYGLYSGDDIKSGDTVLTSKDILLQTAKSNAEGVATFTADIPLNHTYYIREIQAPENYYQSDETFEFTYAYKNDQTYEYVFSHEFKNEEVRAEVHISKIDKETHSFICQGDATLVGAEYGLFAAENIKHPNKKSDDLYQKGDLVTKGKIKKDGTLDFTNLYLGKYYVKEITPSEGYLLDSTEYPVDAAYEGQDVKIVHRDVTVQETVKKQPFQMIKVGSDKEQTEATLLQAGFKIYLISSLKGVKNGTIKPDDNGNYTPEQFRTYDFSEDTTALDYSVDSHGTPIPELFTDEKGNAISPDLAYGKYVVIETTTPEDYSPIDPFIVSINEDKREPQQWRVFIDYEFEVLLKIYKVDETSKLPVLHAGATFKIFDMDNGEYVKQYTHYPELAEHTEFTTSDQGYLITPEKLKMGHYRLEESAAPEGYVKGEPVEFSLTSTGAYEIEGETGAVIIKMNYEDQRQTGTLRLQKTGEKLTGLDSEKKNILQRFGEFLGLGGKEDTLDFNFIYEEGPLEGAVFEVYAAENICSPDYQCDEQGNRVVLYKKDELVSKLTTDSDGKAILSELPLGSYQIVETAASNGYVLNEEVQKFTLAYAGDEVEVVYHDSKYVNKRQKVSLQIKKLDVDTKKPVAGTAFNLYAAEDILAADGKTVLAPADSLIDKGISDENGHIQFTKDLPIAHYYAKESKSAPGYVLNEEKIDFNLQYTDQTSKTLEAIAEVTNDYTKVEISKVDIGGEEVIGAKLIIKDSEENEVASWVTDGTPHRIDRLPPGDYVLIEVSAPDGYEIAEEVPFTVLETGEIQRVEMVDEFEKTGTISVNKIGDMLTGISTYDSDFGKINRMEYEKRRLPGVEFTIYDADGNVADVITSNEDGIATSKELPLGEYTLKETKTPAGLAMNHTVYEAVLTKDKKDEVVDVSIDIENNTVDTEINVYKVGEMLNPENNSFGYGKKPLEGVYFGIYTNEEIKNYRNEGVLPADSLIGVIKTNAEGKATLKAALVSGHYYYKELQTIEGYILDEDKHEFELTLENEPVTVFDVNKENPALNKLVKAKVTLVKVDANDEAKKLSGAEFELFTSEGESLGIYVTDKNGEINVPDLGYGKYYFRENKSPSGYQKLADNIEFSMKGQDITITCRNHIIPKTSVPKLGFEDSTLLYALGFVCIGLSVLGISLYIYRKKKNSRK